MSIWTAVRHFDSEQSIEIVAAIDIYHRSFTANRTALFRPNLRSQLSGPEGVRRFGSARGDRWQ